ncbi:MAG: hypothetical protein EOM20_04450 [Spartobacteria bacterium]|nr:hypothetical protein [Spartobacteria bacterium]
MRPGDQAILYSRDPAWIRRVTAYSHGLLQLHGADREEELERLLDILSPTLLILDLRAKGARDLPALLRRRYPDILVIACGEEHSDPVMEARMAGVYGTVAFDVPAPAFKDLLHHSLDYLEAGRLIRHLQQRPTPQAGPEPVPTAPFDVALLRPFAAAQDRKTTAALVLERWAAATGALRLSLFLRAAETGLYELFADRNATPHARDFSCPADHPLPRRLHDHAQIIRSEALPACDDPSRQTMLRQSLAHLSATLILPFIHDGMLTGWMACSGAADGRAYPPHELQAFIALAQLTAEALAVQAPAQAAQEIDAAPMPSNEPSTAAPPASTAPPPSAHRDSAMETPTDDDELWSDLATSMAHEIRNPLVAIKTFSQLLPERYDDADFRGEFSRLVADEVARLNNTVEEINTFAHPPELVFRTVLLARVMDNALERVKRETRSAHLPVTITDATQTTVALHGDERALSESLAHLILNAVEATRQQKRPVVKVSIQQTASQEVLIMVADNGPGIPPPLQRKLFSPFCTTKARGLGLGLPVARRAILRHGGDITIDPAPEGTVVTVSLPILTLEQHTHETSPHC